MNEDNLHPWIDPELEVRLTAYVLGEASDFEREEMERLLAENAELAVCKKRLEAVHGLLREVAAEGAGEAMPDKDGDDQWKLSAPRRRRVLATLSREADGDTESGATSVVGEVVEPQAVQSVRFPWSGLARIVALFCVLLLGAGLLSTMLPLGMKRAEAPELAMASSDESSHFSYGKPRAEAFFREEVGQAATEAENMAAYASVPGEEILGGSRANADSARHSLLALEDPLGRGAGIDRDGNGFGMEVADHSDSFGGGGAVTGAGVAPVAKSVSKSVMKPAVTAMPSSGLA
ncbi:MAG: hypothetical protein ACC661_11315, partial [Verrucomicrobiales bacterium]